MGTVFFPLSFAFGDDRSYLYKGKSKKELTPQERQLEELYDKLDRPGNRLTDTQFFQTPEAAQLLDRLYGGITDSIPPGSQIISQTPSKVTYRDAEGYEHTITRKPDGQFTRATNRPAVLPNAQRQSMIDTLQQRVQQGLTENPTLAQLDPETAAALQAISDAEVASNDQQLQQLQSQLLARLYGSGVNRSSIATNAGAQFAQQAGLVQQRQKSDAANRALSIRNLLTTLRQQQGDTATSLYANLTGQGAQADIANAGFNLDSRRLDESARQFNATNTLDALRAQLEREAFEASQSPLNQISRLIGVGTQAAGAASGGLAAYRALTRG